MVSCSVFFAKDDGRKKVVRNAYGINIDRYSLHISVAQKMATGRKREKEDRVNRVKPRFEPSSALANLHRFIRTVSVSGDVNLTCIPTPHDVPLWK